jgi:hypothetical protein
MSSTTFSGPIKAGTIKDTIGTTVGTNVANTGFVTMAQSIIVDITGASALNQRVAIVPANSQIIDVILNVTTANTDTGAATVSVGTAADADAFLATIDVKALATTHGTLDTEATNVGTTDLEVFADFTAANGDGTGAGTVTVVYLQNNNLS